MEPRNDAALTQVRYETPRPHVARIVLNRPEKRNAQGTIMTYQLDRAFRNACHDDDVHVIILAAEGDHFCAGHDLGGTEPEFPTTEETVGLWGQYGGPGWEGYFSRERELYFDITERWRNIPKPTIAEVQGACIAGGNMLAWACDLIVCADDARFKDNTIDMAMPGAEFFAHPWELGVRKAKEWLFTGDWITAADAEKRGMVNHVVPRAELADVTLDLASRIAGKDRFALKLAKEACNAAQDSAGRRQAMSTAFMLHQIGHMQNMMVHGFLIDTSNLTPSVRQALEAAKRDSAARRGAQ
ncbi:enoyl-CoA hydratase [Rhizorhabdus wittichii]|uniref:enoyl-CoA hydratase n=1 Tax=Rhizorhabdus wittichii TaxID=160791 RepID=UPI0002EEFF20|nr:enoyl-CoA hydratase [Rhizorhabdus wittichii]